MPRRFLISSWQTYTRPPYTVLDQAAFSLSTIFFRSFSTFEDRRVKDKIVDAVAGSKKAPSHPFSRTSPGTG
jgi:hypothetical protein